MARNYRSKSPFVKGLLSAALLAGSFVFFIIAAWFGLIRGNVPADTKTQSYIVQSGDSLWSIASRFDSRDNTEAVEAWIERENGIGADIQPGMTIKVPVGGDR
ncbi:LysM peptidoglycan-binding domain-containing protein [Alicyclobacillus suci]|uniref:LysM peptidoglycan-binding domain-containing protein n=1 Tax=Alicyclobacillus suci TaxID=2816080 RepID=UPI001A8D6F1E|nr:LysM peptidoglycan-binding domain-containing protein [Alicyclobacillus suci]